MPNRPTRPGKHVARHKAPGRFSRATQRVAPARYPLRLGRTGGTVFALGAVVLAGAAGNGSADLATGGPTSSQVTADGPSSRVTAAVAEARVAGADEASRSQQSRESLARARERSAAVARAEERDHVADSRPGGGSHARTARAESTVPEDPRAIARSMMDEYGWDSSEFSCLDQLWISESDWDVDATNPTSGAYGIPQSLPPEKMATAGPDWRTNPATQIEWGLEYIDLSYGTPCSAWEFKQDHNWY